MAFIIPSVGAVIAAVWGVIMFILKVTGKDDDVKHGFAHIMGFVTSEDELAAYDNVTKKIDEWVNIHNMYPNYR